MKHLTPTIRLFVFAFGILLSNPALAAFEWAGMQWTPTFSVDETYDSNVTYAPDNEHEDFITSLAPGIEATAEGKTQFMHLGLGLHQKLYAKDSDLNNFSQDFDGLYKKEFSEYDRIAVSDEFLHADQASSFDDEFGRQSGRYDFIDNLLNMSYAHDFSSQLTGSIKYENDFYDPDRADLSKSVANEIGLQTDYAISSQTIPFLLYEYSQRDYTPGGTISRNSIGGGLKYYLTEQLYLTGRLLADFIDPIGGEQRTEPNFLVGVMDEADPTTTYGAYYSKHFEDSSYDQDLLDSWRFSLSWGKELLERLRLYLTGFVGGGEFKPSGTKEDLLGAGLTVDYEVLRDQFLAFGFRLSNKNSDDDTRDYEKATVSLNWRIRF